jgi:ABC-type phosphate/phosphonate transport system substrate-binding protein
MTRVASLGMYDYPWLAATNDALWATLRSELRATGVVDVPEVLDNQRPLRAIWRDPALLLAQACGYPLLTEFAGTLCFVATPVYVFPGCDGALHRSLVIVREDEPATSLPGFRGCRCAINGCDSNTGMNLLRALVAAHAGGRPFFADVLETGAHLESLRAVRRPRRSCGNRLCHARPNSPA